jgi:hypothetical protein
LAFTTEPTSNETEVSVFFTAALATGVPATGAVLATSSASRQEVSATFRRVIVAARGRRLSLVKVNFALIPVAPTGNPLTENFTYAVFLSEGALLVTR